MEALRIRPDDQTFYLRVTGLAAILAVTIAAYWGVMSNGFVLDDAHTIVNNPSVRSLNAPWWSPTPDTTNGPEGHYGFRPTLFATYAVDHAVWGAGPRGFHATNLAIHLAVVLFTFALAKRLWATDGAALASAAIMALHPINAEAVNYVGGRSSSLVTLLVLAAIWAHDKHLDDHRTLSRVAGYVFGLLALGTKETAFVLPVLVVLWEGAVRRPVGPWYTTGWRSWPWWALVAAVLAFRTWVLSAGQTLHVAGSASSVLEAMFFALKIYLTSVRYWVFPVGLATDQGWTPHMETAEGLLLIAGAVSLVGATVFLMRADRKLGMCLAWFLAAVLPAGILPFISGLTLYQDHRVYLAGVAFAWAAGWLLWRISRLRPQTRLMGVLGVAGLTVCVVTIVWVDRGRTAVWSDSLRLWDDVLSKHPASFIAHSSRGEALLRAGRLREARQALERAIQLAPGYPTPHNNLGVLLLREGDAANAALEFERAISLKPGYSTAALNLADAYRRLERVDAALTVYDGLSKQYPDWPEPLIRSASLLKSLGRLDGAIDRYRRAVGKHPERDDAVLRLGATLLLANRWAEARDVFTAFRSRHPRSYPAQYCIGLTYAREGDDDRALIEWRKALSLDASHPDLPFELGLLHARRGQWADAAAWHEHALRIDPGHRLAHLNFAVAAVLTGRPEIAAVHFKAFQTATDRLQLERRHDARSTPSEGFFPDTIGF